jgi:DNA-binding Lrp family transcriptional regulator
VRRLLGVADREADRVDAVDREVLSPGIDARRRSGRADCRVGHRHSSRRSVPAGWCSMRPAYMLCNSCPYAGQHAQAAAASRLATGQRLRRLTDAGGRPWRPDRAIDDLDAGWSASSRASPGSACWRRRGDSAWRAGDAQARLDRLQARGVIRGFGPTTTWQRSATASTAFATLEIAQGRGHDVQQHLARIPQVLEAHTITGPGDLLVRIAARDNEHLQQVIDRVLEVHGIRRTSTVIALSSPVPYRVLPLVDEAAR